MKKDRRSYRSGGLDFSNLTFQSASERKYVETNVEKIASKIRELRKQQGLSQEKLAELTSISVSTIKFIEQNQRAPSVPMLLKILYVLDKKAVIWG